MYISLILRGLYIFEKLGCWKLNFPKALQNFSPSLFFITHTTFFGGKRSLTPQLFLDLVCSIKRLTVEPYLDNWHSMAKKKMSPYIRLLYFLIKGVEIKSLLSSLLNGPNFTILISPFPSPQKSIHDGVVWPCFAHYAVCNERKYEIGLNFDKSQWSHILCAVGKLGSSNDNVVLTP